MGNGSSCKPVGTVDTTNRCTFYQLNKADDNTYPVPNSCSPIFTIGFVGDQTCEALSDQGEWAQPIPGKRCSAGSKPGVAYTCDDGDPGNQIRCTRQKYTGDPTTCCIKDDDYRNTNNSVTSSTCFSDEAHQRTCPVNNRSMTSNLRGRSDPNTPTPGCQDLLADYCSGQDVTDSSWINRWAGESSPCVRAVKRNLFTGEDQTGRIQTSPSFTLPLLTPGQVYPAFSFINSQGFGWSRDLMNAVLDRYQQDGFTLGQLPGLTGYNDFQNSLYSICQNVPGLCQEALDASCANETTNRLLINPVRVQWCGCHMDGSQYASYQNNFAINRECTPICNRQGNIANAPPSGIGKITCQQGICMIDNVNLTLAGTDVAGSVNFNQVCGGCGGQSSCQCYLLNTNIDTANAAIGGNINFQESCSGTTCYRSADQGDPDTTSTNGDGRGAFNPNTDTTAAVPCDAPVDFNPVEEQQQLLLEQQLVQGRDSKIRIILAVAIVIVIIFLILLLTAQGHRPDRVIPRTAPGGPSGAGNLGSQSVARGHTLHAIPSQGPSNMGSTSMFGSNNTSNLGTASIFNR